MPSLIGEELLPAFEKHYGFKRTAPEIEFFTILPTLSTAAARMTCAPNIWTRVSSKPA